VSASVSIFGSAVGHTIGFTCGSIFRYICESTFASKLGSAVESTVESTLGSTVRYTIESVRGSAVGYTVESTF